MEPMQNSREAVRNFGEAGRAFGVSLDKAALEEIAKLFDFPLDAQRLAEKGAQGQAEDHAQGVGRLNGRGNAHDAHRKGENGHENIGEALADAVFEEQA